MSGLLTFDRVHFAYPGGKTVFSGLELTFRAGELAAVLGPNGSGKSTMLQLGCGMLRPDSGKVLWRNQELCRFSAAERAKRIAVTFQLTSQSLPYTVMEIVKLGRIAHRKWFEPYSAGDAEAAEHALEVMGLAGRQNTFYQALSGGEKQRVLLAAALAQEPELLFLDEPTSALDFGHKYKLLQLLAELAETRGMAVVMISHDLEAAARYAGRIVFLKNGHVEADGPPAQVMTPENLSRCYECLATVVTGPSGEPLVTCR